VNSLNVRPEKATEKGLSMPAPPQIPAFERHCGAEPGGHAFRARRRHRRGQREEALAPAHVDVAPSRGCVARGRKVGRIPLALRVHLV
jgi:hypothetical protein